MKQDEIIEMARQAGIPFNKWGMVGCEDCEQDIDQNLVAFAKLVAAEVKEALTEQHMNDIWQAIKIEREACAKLVDYWEAREGEHADAIRARGEA